jgi:hypothetical protein
VYGGTWNGSSGERGRSRAGPKVSASRRNERAGLVYAGSGRLFRLLRNARSAHCPHALGPVATQGRPWRQWKTPRRRRATLIALGVKGKLASNTPPAVLVPGILPGARLSQSASATSTSDRSVFHLYLARVSEASRTAEVGTPMPGGVGGAASRGAPHYPDP